MRNLAFAVLLLSLAACDNFTPRQKVATVDSQTGALVLPHPCPDWSQSQVHNYLNEPHSNFGCATNTNTALQLADPQDLVRGHGVDGPDGNITAHVVEQYRAGTLPQPITPTPTTGAASQ